MVIDAFGGPDVFREADMSKPAPGPTQVLVKVHAAAINPVDYKIRQAGAWAGLQFPAILGWDVSGVIEEIGVAVRDFEVGDEVFYCAEIFGCQGAYAEYHVTEASVVAHKPANLTHFEAASIPLAGGTAWEGVIVRAKLRVGETALIHAGAGGVGSAAIQIAKAAGARVFATSRAANLDLLHELGADRAIDYRTEDVVAVVLAETGGAGVDFTFDTVGGDTLTQSIEATKPWGRIAAVVPSSAPIDAAFHKNLTIHFEFSPRNRAKMEALRTLAERGQLKPIIETVLPLSHVAQAHERLEMGCVRGKIVLDTSR
jgi:NADPH2:quinone reductase